jgi:hypothetical protein
LDVFLLCSFFIIPFLLLLGFSSLVLFVLSFVCFFLGWFVAFFTDSGIYSLLCLLYELLFMIIRLFLSLGYFIYLLFLFTLFLFIFFLFVCFILFISFLSFLSCKLHCFLHFVSLFPFSPNHFLLCLICLHLFLRGVWIVLMEGLFSGVLEGFRLLRSNPGHFCTDGCVWGGFRYHVQSDLSIWQRRQLLKGLIG